MLQNLRLGGVFSPDARAVERLPPQVTRMSLPGPEMDAKKLLKRHSSGERSNKPRALPDGLRGARGRALGDALMPGTASITCQSPCAGARTRIVSTFSLTLHSFQPCTLCLAERNNLPH
uniref:Uncharacterized protein n=1 Tax=Rangifer tarandus platyrhynchus TaxID=3082113 RepID=A0ACB0E3F3_RANTA|nr:unnamed protein product [Rangifer tarandus platyrhynchus]